jgi:hypothetical protein
MAFPSAVDILASIQPIGSQLGIGFVLKVYALERVC